MTESKNPRETFDQLIENLGTLGSFMLAEVQSNMKNMSGASKQEFFASVDRVAESMKRSGQIAADDIERTADEIKKNWSVIDKETKEDWEMFMKELKGRLSTLSSVSQETFAMTVDQVRKTMDKQWTAASKAGEQNVEFFKKQSERMADTFKGYWKEVLYNMEKTGQSADRAVQAFWDEWKKRD